MTTSALGRSASRGAVVSVAGQLLRVVLQTATVVVLARLLAPADYGLIAEVLVVIGIGEIVRDFGLSSAAVQARQLSHAERSNLFWANAAVGAGLALLAVLLSPAVASLYGDPRLTQLTCVLAGTFLLNGLSTQLRADLNRRLAFGRITLTEIVGQAAGLAVGVGMAVADSGYWALAGQQLAGAAVTLAGLWFATRFRPARYDRSTSIRRFVGFGLDVVGGQLLGYAGKNTDTFIIGAVLGATPLGFYNRAFQLVTLPLSQINAPATRVALPVLSQLQDEPGRFMRYVVQGQTVMLHLVLALFSWSGALAVPMFHLVLGERWVPSAGLFQILVVAGVFSTAGYGTYWIFMARGLTRSLLWWQVASRPLVIGMVLGGVLWGVGGVAAGYALANALLWPIGLIWTARASGASTWPLFTGAARAIGGYGAAAVAAFVAALAASTDPVAALATGTAAWVVALAVVCLWPAFRHDLLSLPATVARVRGGRRGAAADTRVPQAVP